MAIFNKFSLSLWINFLMSQMNMKNVILALSMMSMLFFGCQGTVDPGKEDQNGNQSNTDDLKGSITLYADKMVINADGAYVSELSVRLMDSHGKEHDVTADVEIYIEGEDTPISDPRFKTTVEGNYVFYAVRGFDISNSVTVQAVKGVPTLPADSDASKTTFAHRMLLVQHTGNECPNCPKLMDILKHIADDDQYNSRYLHVASHSYNESDEAYSEAAKTLSKNFGVTLYPMLTYNLTETQGYFEEDVKEAIMSLSKDVAEVGIRAASTVEGDKIIANLEIKSAVASKYRIAVWVLEDNIHSPQSGATSSWHNNHNNCLRLMYGQDKIEGIFGRPVGSVEAGASEDMIVAIDLDSEWIIQNCKLLIIATEANGAAELANCVYCPLQGSVSYNYL